MWDKDGGYEIPLSELVIKIAKSEAPCVTILGGEPFDQYYDLYNLIISAKSLGKNIILYTGYEWKDNKIGKHSDEILKYVDVFVCEPYIEEQRNLENHLKGSTNQQIHFLTDKYKAGDIVDGTYVEIDIDNNGSMEMFGYPDDFMGVL